jgi:predicted nucleic acid-binding Zn ribbon protein
MKALQDYHDLDQVPTKVAAALLGYSEAHLRRMVAYPLQDCGPVPRVVQANGRVSYVIADLKAWLKKRELNYGR